MSNKKYQIPAAATYADMAVPMATLLSDEEFSKKHTPSSHEKASHTHGIKQWPSALREQLVRTFKRAPDERKAGDFLGMYNWPDGLKSTVFKSCRKIPLRFFIIDDSG